MTRGVICVTSTRRVRPTTPLARREEDKDDEADEDEDDETVVEVDLVRLENALNGFMFIIVRPYPLEYVYFLPDPPVQPRDDSRGRPGEIRSSLLTYSTKNVS